jgi:hypothetical protein
VFVSLFFLYASYQQHVHPWEVRYTGELRTVVGKHAVTFVLFVQAASMAWAALGLFWKLPKPGQIERGCMPASITAQAFLTSSVAGALSGCAFWGHAMRANILKHGYDLGATWELLWLPLGPLAYSLVCVWLMYSMVGTGKEVRDLRQMAYAYKKV